MFNNSVLKIPELNFSVNRAIETSVAQIGYQSISPSFELQNSLKSNLETSLQSWTSNLKTNNANCPTCPTPPGYGFKVNFGLQILLDYKIRVKANAGLGYGQRWGDAAGIAALNASVYNHGLGTPVNGKDLVVDVTAVAYLTVGGGKSTPLTTNTLNYNSPSAIQNDFQNSFSYGQLLTWNSALNGQRFSLADIQRQGMIGFRLGDFNVSSNNDTKYYGGDAGDKKWTGGISVVTPLFEVGFQDFSGDYLHGKDRFDDDDELREFNKKNGINSFESFHRQTQLQKNLNKASTYFRFSTANGDNLTVDFVGDAWFQNAIHKAIKDFRFEYNFKDTDIWVGKEW